MSGLEPIIAAEAAAATTAAASTTAAAATAEIVAAEAAAAAAAEAAAAEAARQAALNAFASSAGEAIGAEAAGATALEAAPSLLDPLSYLDPQYAAQNNLFGPNIEFMPTEAGQEILLRSGAETTSDALAKEALENYAQSADAVLQQGSTPSFQDMAWDKVLRQGMDADMPGATWRSIQAGLQNNALNTIGSLPQYLGMPAPPPGAGKALQAARLLSPQQDRGTRTNVSPPMLNKGREVNLGAPIAGLLGGMQMPKRRRLSLIWDRNMDEFDTYPAGLLEMLGVDREKMRQQQMTQGLLSAGLQLLAGSGYSPVRRTTGELLGQAGVAGLGAYQQAGESSIDRALKGMQVKQMMDKQKREAQFAESIRNAYRMAPTTTGIGQQQEAALMAQMQFPGEEAPQAQDVNLTRQALLSNQGLPQERVLDQQKFMSALAEYNPLEYAKMMFKEDKVPDAIRTLEILNKRPDLLKTELERRRAESAQINLPGKTQLELMSEVYAPQVKVAFDEAKQARDFANSASTVANLLKGKGGGEMVRIGTVLSRNLGLGDKETVAAADLAESLATRGAVSMRAPGSGSTSDIEFTAYREAFPSLRNSDDGRQLMAKYAGKFADRAEKIADYKAKLLASGQYSLEAVRKYDESLGPVLGDDFYKFKPTQSSGKTRDYRGGR